MRGRSTQSSAGMRTDTHAGCFSGKGKKNRQSRGSVVTAVVLALHFKPSVRYFGAYIAVVEINGIC